MLSVNMKSGIMNVLFLAIFLNYFRDLNGVFFRFYKSVSKAHVPMNTDRDVNQGAGPRA